MFKLLIANIKMTLRDKQALFWSLLFPTMFIVIFGLFDFTKMGNTKYFIIDQANSEISSQFKEGLKKIEFLKLTDGEKSLEEAKKMLRDGDIDFIIDLPSDFKINMPKVDQIPLEQLKAENPPNLAEMPKPGAIKVYYDQSNITVNQLVFSVIDKFVDQMNLNIASAPSIFSYETEGIQSKNIKYLDIIMPGILGMAIMSSAIIGISTGITKYKEQKLLKRLSATPLKVRDFLMAEVFSYLALNLAQITLIILVARLAFNVKVYGSYLLIYTVCLFGSIIFLNIGFAIAGYAKSVNTAEAVAQVVFMPMMFFSGVFFSTEALPKIVGKIVQFLPLTPMIDALRMVSIDEAGIVDIYPKLLFMLGWIIIAFLLAWRVFKFKD